jgi:glycosyltransferase involved in cell wall biosynthesis
MNIALLSFEYPEETGFGGIGTYTWYQARALVKLGHSVHVLAGADRPTALRSVEHDGVVVHRFRSNWSTRVLGGVDALGLFWSRARIENALNMWGAFRRLAREHRYDVVEMPECGGEGAFLNHVTEVPSVVRFHSPAALIMPTYDTGRVDRLLCSLVEGLGIRGATALTSCSQFVAREVRSRMGVDRKITVIPNGIDLKLFDSTSSVDVRRTFGIPRGKTMIVFTGRMEPRKGIHLCKEIAGSVLQRHASAAFVFAGADPFGYMQTTLLPYLRSLPLRGSVHYIGKLGLVEMRSCLRQASIFLLPSVWENCPYACLEAMAAGVPIVSSDAGGMPELVRDEENGLLAPWDQARPYILAIERLLDDRTLRDRLATAARQRVEEHHTDVRMAEESVTVYGEAGRRAAG